MNKFRKKPVVIEARQWGGPVKYTEPPDEIVRHYRRPDRHGESLCSVCQVRFHDHGWIDTLEGGLRVCPGDWIIKGVKGEYYPIKDEIFKETYEAVYERKEGS